jgi:hypothetical protein
MSVRDLLTFNLFLQLTDGLVSGFRTRGGRSQSRSGRCNRKLGNDWGADLQQNAGVPTAAPDICIQAQPTITCMAGIDCHGLDLRLHYYRLSLGTFPRVSELTIYWVEVTSVIRELSKICVT